MDNAQSLRGVNWREQMPEWGTRESKLWGIAHPDCPWSSPEAKVEYAYPNGRWWRVRFGDNVPPPNECV